MCCQVANFWTFATHDRVRWLALGYAWRTSYFSHYWQQAFRFKHLPLQFDRWLLPLPEGWKISSEFWIKYIVDNSRLPSLTFSVSLSPYPRDLLSYKCMAMGDSYTCPLRGSKLGCSEFILGMTRTPSGPPYWRLIFWRRYLSTPSPMFGGHFMSGHAFGSMKRL